MALVRLYLVVISLCVVSSACAKKAKMRTVPRQASATAGAVPPASTLSEAPSGDEDASDKTAKGAPNYEPRNHDEESATAAPPAPPSAVTPLSDEPGDRYRVSVPPSSPGEQMSTGDGELNRPRSHPPIPLDRREEVSRTDCIPSARRSPRRPRHPVVEGRPGRMEQHRSFEFEPTDELHCRWEPTARPMTYLKYDPITKTALVRYGWPQRWSNYTRVYLVTGLPPYGAEGLSLVSKSGVPIAHLRPTGNGTIWYERGTSYPYEAYFGDVPGGPQGEAIRGVCWTRSEPSQTSESGN